ncbi:C3HC zinc finger-like-domain-containing protein [Elsinoe ampelina]|uniref:C3HC zinc finger-like-domain-containing protein n=1 Tax=Elsinoe ampelina TaxID=302913 RepID=A0A6A6GP08_9PEZI|nr:C3HC zinc finger-like-domain-containing protein [Elsinoe ampelina]
MPEATATRKRRFYGLLDKLTQSSGPASKPSKTSAPTSRPTTSGGVTSNPRPSTPSSHPSISSPRPSTSSQRPSISAPRPIRPDRPTTLATPGAPPPIPRIPHFTPWSHEDFLERLKTFAPVTSWFPKPEGVGEVEWAKRGWECVGNETVGCKGCKRRVVVDFTINGIGGDDEQAEDNVDESEEEAEFENTFEKALAEKYAEEIIKGHSESCPWRKTGCKDDIYRLPVVRTAWWQDTVRTSFTSVLEIKEDIENLRIHPISASPPADKLLLHIPPIFFNPNATPRNNSVLSNGSVDDPSVPSDEIMARALMIALTGWHATCESRTNLLVCDACFQRIGLWMYQSKPSTSPTTIPAGTSPLPTTPSTQSTSLTPAIKSVSFGPSPPSSPSPTSSHPPLDLLASHREHCPYRSPSSQAATGDYVGFPAWRILWTTAARYADEQRRRSVAAKPGLGMGGLPGLGLGMKEGLSREEVARLDKERVNKLRRLKSALGIKLGVPRRGGGGREGEGSWV